MLVNVFDQRALREIVPSSSDRRIIGKRALGNCPWRFAEAAARKLRREYWVRMHEDWIRSRCARVGACGVALRGARSGRRDGARGHVAAPHIWR
jgi:hypothetical protein